MVVIMKLIPDLVNPLPGRTLYGLPMNCQRRERETRMEARMVRMLAGTLFALHPTSDDRYTISRHLLGECLLSHVALHAFNWEFCALLKWQN